MPIAWPIDIPPPEKQQSLFPICTASSSENPNSDASSSPAETTLDDPQAEGSEALAMQFYRTELGEQRCLMASKSAA
jgi:hypothetical protein